MQTNWWMRTTKSEPFLNSQKNSNKNDWIRERFRLRCPKINVWIDEDGSLNVSKTNRESPGRILVAELMIMANWLMARYLSSKGIPAIFRTQPEPKERLFRNNEGTLFQNWMQRKYLSRFILSPEPEISFRSRARSVCNGQLAHP